MCISSPYQYRDSRKLTSYKVMHEYRKDGSLGPKVRGSLRSLYGQTPEGGYKLGKSYKAIPWGHKEGDLTTGFHAFSSFKQAMRVCGKNSVVVQVVGRPTHFNRWGIRLYQDLTFVKVVARWKDKKRVLGT